MIIKQQIRSNKRIESYIYYCYLEKKHITLYRVDLMVHILVDLLLLCLVNIKLHFSVVLEENNSSNRLNYNYRNEIMYLHIIRYHPIVYMLFLSLPFLRK